MGREREREGRMLRSAMSIWYSPASQQHLHLQTISQHLQQPMPAEAVWERGERWKGTTFVNQNWHELSFDASFCQHNFPSPADFQYWNDRISIPACLIGTRRGSRPSLKTERWGLLLSPPTCSCRLPSDPGNLWLQYLSHSLQCPIQSWSDLLTLIQPAELKSFDDSPTKPCTQTACDSTSYVCHCCE